MSTAPLDETLKKAIALHDAGKYGEAAEIYRDLLCKDPNNVLLMHLLALVAMQMDQPNMVLVLSEQGLSLRPDIAVLHQDRATALRRLGRKEEALAAIHQALALDPKQADFYHTLSSIQRDMRQYGLAVESLNKAITLNPDDPKFYNNLAICLSRMGANEEALSTVDRYIKLRPDMAEGYNNKANILKSLRHYREALENYDKALAINPHIFMGKANKGITHLVVGDYRQGWELFEHRLPGNMPPEAKRFDPARRWKGQSDPKATLIIYNEQGLGDTVQFCRYVPQARGRMGRVILQAQAPLLQLMKFQWPDLEIISPDDPLPEYHYQCPLMSLPHVFGVTVENLPVEKIYLRADPAKTRAWQEKLPQNGLKRIGLVWAGNPDHMNDHLRSIPLAQFAPLWQIPGLHFFSLQKGQKALEEMACLPAALPFTPAGDALKDFSDTAGLIANLDLLVSVDTATLHLAGALGVPGYGLLQYDPDWRWLASRPDTPWYASLRLFRQRHFGKWEGAVEELCQTLSALFRK
ncbi:MAG: tetratricopeptide repeat protein [Proteobacteria bacterium]|nr:tetratricopeptide repeat protein [Pseudomonadota bacterium]